MRLTVPAITLLCLSLATGLPQQTALAQNDRTSPDFDRAYALATASYCAYTVGQAEDDRGAARAVRCLKAAAGQGRDNAGLAAFKNITQDNVEAFFDPKAPENAYLLIQTTAGVILAFRGTLTPPIAPSDSLVPAAVTADKVRELKLFNTFFDDWRNNFNPAAISAPARHPGFDDAWSGLRDHLIATDCAAACSKFRSFVGQLNNTASARLYITGHSKGGALAVLAALDLPPRLGGDIAPVVYTFAGAKVLTAAAAAQSGPAFKDMWRFEHAGDLVPRLPLDKTVPLPFFTPYAHVGNRALFMKGQPLQLSPAPVAPDDSERLQAVAEALFSSDTQAFNPFEFIASVQKLSENNCAALVDSHFLVFAEVEQVVRAPNVGAPMTLTEEDLKRSFFYAGLSDDRGKILWGYSQWCALLTGVPAK